MSELTIKQILKDEVLDPNIEGLFKNTNGEWVFDRRRKPGSPLFNPRIDNLGSNIIGDMFVVVEADLAEELINIKNNATIGDNND